MRSRADTRAREGSGARRMLRRLDQPVRRERRSQNANRQPEQDICGASQGGVRGSGHGHGLAFTAVDPDRLPILKGWLAELNGDIQPTTAALEQESQKVTTENAASQEQSYVLNELIIALMRKMCSATWKARRYCRSCGDDADGGREGV
jgi:hypothetical protein